MSHRVRDARAPDVPAIWDLLQGLARYERLEHEVSGSAEALARHLFGPAPALEAIVAEAEIDAPVDAQAALEGYALCFPVFSSFRTTRLYWLEDLYVVPHARGSGLGRRLLAAVARRAQDRGAAGIAWNVLDWNRDAIGFYRRLGASPEAGWTTYALSDEPFAALAAEAGRA